MTPAVIAAGLETAFNQYLRLDPDVLPRLAALNGRIIAIEAEGLGVSFYLLPGVGGVQVVDQYDGEPTVRIRGTPLALVQQWRGQRAASGDIIVEGDAVVGREFQAILAQMDIDWEEHLSRVVGDAVAHQLSNLWQGFRTWGRRAGDLLRRDSAEYLQYELQALPPRHAVEQFLNAVDTLREDADRLAARVERLRWRLSAGDPA
ncbi:MAG: SCP2 sterol-binding domain-containing protein [Candidatus Competibacteraceae bacterium]